MKQKTNRRKVLIFLLSALFVFIIVFFCIPFIEDCREEWGYISDGYTVEVPCTEDNSLVCGTAIAEGEMVMRTVCYKNRTIFQHILGANE